MTNRFVIVGFVAVLVVLAARPVAAQRQTTTSADALDNWVTAVNMHVPGRPDASVGAVIAMTYDARRGLNTAMSLFIRGLLDREAVAAKSEMAKLGVRPADKVTALAQKLRLTPGAETFLMRAAVVHSDAVVFAHRFPEAPDDVPSPPKTQTISGGRSAIAVPPLLTNERVTLTRDGEVIGDAPATWHLPFARSLLDVLFSRAEQNLPSERCAGANCARDGTSGDLARTPPLRLAPADQEFVGEWYHAVAAYLFSQGMNGDATAHLQHAARVLPDDARVLFDRGSYAETFGLPIYQAVQETASAQPRAFIARIPTEDRTNAEAERLYRRALEIDAGYLEARVRLARLLDRRGQHDEAAAQITPVLEAQPTGVLGFYALIVGGRVATARRRHDEALQHYHAASLLYPGAQSALLGASHAALMLADLPGTLEPIQRLGTDVTSDDDDPWLDYQLGAGRDVNPLMVRLWAHVPK